ncbi:hypothetical protein KZZ52_10490 [Dactylosporangium sp. AC04546]|uniref:hypothetical protein n=1 Tax=Dactylosporangium sp. AC04546 TaxID=2862460 RepID=UPI001EDF10BF|nr:hypothetical protein [Dactylosporangium sp. AC04546]WVK85786.1 hypothetical protein KZZ52_10490 [Dactylosporangium sp. AC04546]
MFPLAMIVSQSAMAREFPGSWAGSEGFEFSSALPHAPVVPYPEPSPRAYRTRAAIASTLRRAATAIAPPATCSPAG